jgi:hypothetical protein
METKRERESESQRVREFIRGYITAALWSSVDDDETPLDDSEKYGEEKLAAETREKMASDCDKFIALNQDDLREYAEKRAIPIGAEYTAGECAGHDFWLTRAGHGCGFWDRGLGELGERLSKASASFGECWLYVGDNGNLYTE